MLLSPPVLLPPQPPLALVFSPSLGCARFPGGASLSSAMSPPCPWTGIAPEAVEVAAWPLPALGLMGLPLLADVPDGAGQVCVCGFFMGPWAAARCWCLLLNSLTV